jgi:hypothetical protein
MWIDLFSMSNHEEIICERNNSKNQMKKKRCQKKKLKLTGMAAGEILHTSSKERITGVRSVLPFEKEPDPDNS